MNHQPKTDYSIPLDEFNTRAEKLVNKMEIEHDKLTKVYEKEIKECFKFLDSQFKKYKRKASFQKKIEFTTNTLALIVGIPGPFLAAIIPGVGTIISLIIIGSSSLPGIITFIASTIGFNKLRDRNLKKAYHAKEFKDKLFQLYAKIINDSKITEDEYKQFSSMMSEYDKKDRIDEKERSSEILSAKDLEEIKNLIASQKIKKLSSAGYI